MKENIDVYNTEREFMSSVGTHQIDNYELERAKPSDGIDYMNMASCELWKEDERLYMIDVKETASDDR